MKSLWLLAACILIFSGVLCQKRYTCVFTDTLGVIDPGVQADSMKRSLIAKGLSYDVAERLAKKVFSRADAYLLTLERYVDTDGDSAFIKLNYHSQPGKTLVMSSAGLMKCRHGQLFRYDPANEVFHSIKTAENSRMFSPTGRKQIILGFECDEYVSADSIYRIWVTRQLPSAINPGIAVANVDGAVISFETRYNNAFTRSTLSSLNEVREVI